MVATIIVGVIAGAVLATASAVAQLAAINAMVMVIKLRGGATRRF